MSQSMALCHLAYITEKNRGPPSPFQFQLRERSVAVSEHAEQSDALAYALIQAHAIKKKLQGENYLELLAPAVCLYLAN